MTAVRSSNSVGGPRRGAIRSAIGRTSSTSAAKASASIGRPSTTIRSRYVTRCGLGVSPIRYPAARSAEPGERDDGALPVGAGDERAAHGGLGVVQLAQQGAHPAEAETDAVPAPRLDRRERPGVGEARGGHRLTPW